MRRACAVPRCPRTLEALPNLYFCDEHAAEGYDLEPLHKDEVEIAIAGMLEDAEETLRGPTSLEWERYVAEQVALHVPEVLEAADNGAVWTAVRHALWVGLMSGRSRSAPDERKLRKMQPAIATGLRVRNANLEGRPKLWPPDDELLRQWVCAKLNENPRRTVRRARELVREDLMAKLPADEVMSLETLADRTRGVKRSK